MKINSTTTDDGAQPLMPHPAPAPGYRDGWVAVVDDDLDICVALQEWLQVMDIPARRYLSAETLIPEIHAQGGHWWAVDEAGAQSRLAAVIVDLNLPGMHGFALARVLLDRAPGLRVVVISAAHDDERRRLADGHAKVACVRKPFTLDALEQALLPL